ncbi:hypothetical protein INT43_001159 [Umbelopsis isabellina]|uniref:Uncharacterized protein n=1 Tax=Mortierella isabellina TaxID=91625 RepID=A0A8H7PK48_MORIS|nr:hypothetical protein INT43_001159 [Umbelopsis isabellina]
MFSHNSKSNQAITPETASVVSIQTNEEPLSKKSLIPKALAKYLADPMRSNTHPDVVGKYVDPMGGPISTYAGVDPMNTGA